MQVERMHTYSGCAKWGYDQLLNELARGSWGCIGAAEAAQYYMDERVQSLWPLLVDESIEVGPNPIQRAHVANSPH